MPIPHAPSPAPVRRSARGRTVSVLLLAAACTGPAPAPPTAPPTPAPPAAATVRDVWTIGPNLKAITAMLAAVAVAQGRVSWTTTVGTIFPELVGAVRAEYRPVTLVGRILRLHQTGR